MADTNLYARMWRWHLYAGIFVLPFVLLLSVSGAIYLFKPQIDRWEERHFLDLGTADAVSADRQVAAALAEHPESRFTAYRLPREAGDAAMVQLLRPDGAEVQTFVSPQGEVLGTLGPGSRISSIVATFHGSLMLGDWGDRLVELAASWTVVMLLTGLYLWWPRPFRAGGTLWPRRGLRGRALLKDWHRAIGFWIAGLVLAMLASGLPWAGVWGDAFRWARAELGLVQGPQEWATGAEKRTPEQALAELLVPPATAHEGHDHGGAAPLPPAAEVPSLPLGVFVSLAAAEELPFPALVLPPHSPQRFGPPTGAEWTVKSEAQNRPLNREVTFDPATAEETGRTGWADKHPIDRAVGYGIAWHEGQLFGVPNQVMGLFTALALIGISVLGAVMWWKRKPESGFGAPEVAGRLRNPWVIGAAVVLALLLPLFGLSLIVLLVLDRLLLRWRRA